MSIFSSTVANTLKRTLERVITDKTDGVEKRVIFTRYCDIKDMDDQWEDDLEIGGPGLASEKPEGQEVAMGSIREGTLTRYIARTFAIRLGVTEEAMEDSKYPKAIQAAKRAKRSLWKTADIDAAAMLVRAEDSNYVGGDGLPLASASHTLPHGGTFSNTMSTPMSPSRTSVIVATSAIRVLPSQDGITEGYEPKKVVCPVEQWAVWEGLVQSTHAPEAGQFNEINVVKGLDLEVIPNKYWDNTTTNWCIITDAEGGLNFRWRRRPRAKTWVENSQHIMSYSCDARWARGWTDPRGVYFVGA